jgi:3-hydroxybutyryl-CoA dehydratase
MPEIAIGQCASVSKAFSKSELAEFAALTATNWPISTVPGALIGGLFSYLLGTKLPGSGTIYLKQSLTFSLPASPDQELIATVEITGIRPDKGLITLKTFCSDTAGNIICTGEALVKKGS